MQRSYTISCQHVYVIVWLHFRLVKCRPLLSVPCACPIRVHVKRCAHHFFFCKRAMEKVERRLVGRVPRRPRRRSWPGFGAPHRLRIRCPKYLSSPLRWGTEYNYFEIFPAALPPQGTRRRQESVRERGGRRFSSHPNRGPPEQPCGEQPCGAPKPGQLRRRGLSGQAPVWMA